VRVACAMAFLLHARSQDANTAFLGQSVLFIVQRSKFRDKRIGAIEYPCSRRVLFRIRFTTESIRTSWDCSRALRRSRG
jgi:hypothetical protein